MYEDCRSQGRHELLPCSNFAHERKYVRTRRGILDRGLVPKRSVARYCELRRPGQELQRSGSKPSKEENKAVKKQKGRGCEVVI